MKTPRIYQDAAIKGLWNWLFTPNTGHPLVVAPVGAGKSLMIAEFIRQCHEKYPRTRIVVLAHVKELLVQNADELRGQYPDCDFGFYCAGLGHKRLHNDVTFASIQSVRGKIAEFNRPPEIIIIDECFTGDTPINTNRGAVRIDKVRLGDIVYNATGYGEVSAISKKFSNIIYKVRLSNGQEIRCTGNHPFFTKRGWVAARNLDKWEELVGIQNMPELWGKFSAVEVDSKEERESGANSATAKELWEGKVLLNILLKEDGKCNVGAGGKGKNVKDASRDRAQAIGSWWEWQRNDGAARKNTGNFRGGVDTRACDTYKSSEENEIIPDLLQGGLRPQGKKDGDRAGWEHPLREKKINGREERQFSNVIRVENIEIEKSGCGEFVYNLQVNGHPSYFANGILVHNCHLISHRAQTQYRRFIDDVFAFNPNAKVIGFTGTPFRADTGRLDEGEGALFDGTAHEIGMDYMIDEGWWAKPVAPNLAFKMDVSGVGTAKGDYIESQLQEKINVAEVTDACVRELIQKGAGRKRWLIFTAGIEHAKEVTIALNAAGVSADAVYSGKDDNDETLKRHKAGQFTALVNVAKLTTGYNDPAIDLLCFMRPTRSPVLYVQCMGRGVRPVYADGFDLNTKEGRLAAIAASDKPDCLVIDFGGVIEELGPIDQVSIQKTFTGDKEPPSEKAEPVTKICPACSEVCHASQRYCYKCSYCFIVLDTKASEKAVISTDEAPEWVDVISMGQLTHRKISDPAGVPSMKVIYATLKGQYYDFICFEHHQFKGEKRYFAYERAVEWFNKFADWESKKIGVPQTIEDALLLTYLQPSAILVKRNGKYWNVIDYKFEKKKEVIEDESWEIPF